MIATAADLAAQHRRQGLRLGGLGRVSEAFLHCHRAVALAPADPENAAALADAAATLASLLPGRAHLARQAWLYRLAQLLEPAHLQALVGLGNRLAEDGLPAAALAQFLRILAIAPDFTRICSNLASVMRRQGRPREAVDLNRRVLVDSPADAAAHYNLAILLLGLGHFAEGWRHYEFRWQTKDFPSPKRDFRQPLWTGEALAGRRILLHSEQGLGDCLQFCRYAPLVATTGRVILEVQAPLVRLLAGLPGIERVIAKGEPLPPFDVHCPLLSLPGAFGTTLDTLPPAPYLRAAGDRAAAWRRRIGDDGRLAVGLVWAGNPDNPRDFERSLAFSLLAPLLRLEGVRWLSLQVGDRAADLAQAPMVEDLSPWLTDFAETAALVSGLDLVISVDSAVAHLTGALGRPGWLLLPWAGDWRWLDGRDDSPWYPTACACSARPRPATGRRSSRRWRRPSGRRSPTNPGKPMSDNLDALHHQAIALHQAGRRVDAAHLYLSILRRRPDHSDARHNLGLVAVEGGDLASGLTAIRAAVATDPSYGRYWLSYVQALTDDGRLDEARRALPRVLRLGGERGWSGALAARLFDPRQLLAEAEARRRASRQADAQELARRVLALLPRSAAALGLLGGLAVETGRPEAAGALLARGLLLDQRQPGLYAEFGRLLDSQGRPAEAEAACRRALVLDPGDGEALALLGRGRWSRGQHSAIGLFRRAVTVNPADHQSHRCLAVYLMMHGRLAEAWEHYEWRWQSPDFSGPPRHFRQPRWTGEALDGRVLLVHGEQGLGDVLQYSRFAVEAARHGRVILEVWPPLLRLLSGLPGVERVVAAGDPLPDFHLHCPLLSLPRVFGTDLDTLPPPVAVPVDRTLAARWRKRLGKAAGRKIGLVWAGGPTAAGRSMAFERLVPLLSLGGLSWFSLQLGDAGAEMAGCRQVADLSPELGDFADTAAALICLDLVITVDTAMAHLAGLLGRPCWVLLPHGNDCRWLINRADSPWYPSLRLFRQSEEGDWPGVIERLAAALGETFGAPVNAPVND
ncbi:MAG TPA: tetratricopeptide repeat protein [Rhodospirillaceae bacterium]|nr:tetratricopeptide repeat protein [Rhodospirillaceae bacterium]